jgi:FxsC-like protein
MPDQRSDNYYGSSALDWNPYHPESNRPLADYTSRLTACVGHQPSKGTFEADAENLAETPPTAPALVLVDAWATLSAERRQRLQRLNDPNQPWISVLVPWNRNDTENNAAEDKLKQGLELALGSKLASAPPAFRRAATEVPTLKAFGDLATEMAFVAGQQYLRHAEARPPEGPDPERPRLSWPDPDDGRRDSTAL